MWFYFLILFTFAFQKKGWISRITLPKNSFIWVRLAVSGQISFSIPLFALQNVALLCFNVTYAVAVLYMRWFCWFKCKHIWCNNGGQQNVRSTQSLEGCILGTCQTCWNFVCKTRAFKNMLWSLKIFSFRQRSKE